MQQRKLHEHHKTQSVFLVSELASIRIILPQRVVIGEA